MLFSSFHQASANNSLIFHAAKGMIPSCNKLVKLNKIPTKVN